MVDQIAYVQFTTPASTGTFDVTSPNITAAFSAALFIYHSFTTDSSDLNHGNIGIGACSATADESGFHNVSTCTQGSNANRTTTDYNTDHGAGAADVCILMVSGTNSATRTVVAAYDSSISGGVRLNFTTTTVQMKVTAILFAGLSDAAVGSVSTGGSTSFAEQVGPVPGLQPDLLISFGGGGALNVVGVDAQPTMGFAVNSGGIPQVSAFINHDDALSKSDADGEISTTNVHAGHQGATRTLRHLQVSAFTSTGFTVSGPSGVSVSMFYLALKFSGNVRKACAAMQISGSTGQQAFNTFGFTPDLVVGYASMLTSVDTYTDGATAGAAGYFVTGRYGSRAVTMHGQEDLSNAIAAPYNTHNRAEDVALLCYEHLGTIANRATWVGGSGSGGFILDFSVATSGYMVALGIQLVPSAPLPRRALRRPKTRHRRRRRRPTVGGKTQVVATGMALVLRAIARFRRAFQARLRPQRPFRIQTGAAVFSDVVAQPRGTIYSAGAQRGKVESGGPSAGSVF